MKKQGVGAFAREVAKGRKTEEDLNEFSQMLTKVTVEAALNAELEDHLGYARHEQSENANSRHVWGQRPPYYPGWLAFILVACLLCSPAHADDNPPPDAELEARFTCSLQPIWDDRRSGADLDGFFYLPNVGPTEYIVGGYGNRNKTLLASDCVLTLRDSAYLAAPMGWELIWKDKGSGARLDGSMWRPVPPSEDYRCLGHVPQEGYDEPYIPNYRCVHASFTEKLIADKVIWSDKGSGANKQVTMLRLPNTYSFVAVEARVGQLEAYDLRVDHSASTGDVVVVQADRSDSSANEVADTGAVNEESSGATIPEAVSTAAEAEQPLKTSEVETQADTADDEAARLRAVAEAALAAADFDLAADYLARLRALQSDSPAAAEEEQGPAATKQEQADDQTPEPGEQRVIQADTSDSPSADKAIEQQPQALEAGNEPPAQTIMDDSEMKNEDFVQAERIEPKNEAARLTAAEKLPLAAEDDGLTTDDTVSQRALRPDSPETVERQRTLATTRQKQTDDQAPEPGEERVVQADTVNVQPGDETPIQAERIESEIEPSNTNGTASQTDNNVLEPDQGTNDSPFADIVPEIDIKISEAVYLLMFLFTVAAIGYFLPGMKKKLWLLIAVLLLLLIYFGIKSYASNIAEKEINKAIGEVSKFVNVNYKSVGVDLFGMDVRISDIIVIPGFDTKQHIEIDEIIIRDIDDKSDIPAFMSVLIHGIKLNADDIEQLPALEQLGYTDELSVDLGMDYVFANDELRVNDLFIKIDDLGELSVDFHLGNLSNQQLSFINLLFSYPEILLYELQIELDVVPLVERYIEAGAEELNISEAEFKSKEIEAIEQAIKNTGSTDNLLYISYLTLKKNYIDEPEEITISMSPTSSYQQLGQIQNLSLEELDYINLQVE